MNEYNINIGIDVAKNHLDVCILPYGKTKRFKNNELGIASLIEFIGDKEPIERIILEPTGGYEELILEILSEKNYKISLVNAAQVRAFLFTVFILLWLFAPLVWIPILTIGSYYNYHCPHCGRKIENL